MKRKFNYLWLSFVIIFLTMQSSAGQNIKSKEVFFRFPEDNVLNVKVIQNKSPVQIESIDVLTDKKGTMPILNWGLRNNSSKTVRRFVIAIKIRTNIDQWRKFVSQSEYDIGTDEKNDLILPQKTYQEYDYSNSLLLPKDKLSNLFSFNKDYDDEIFIMVYGMIKKVVFDDGSVYEEDNKVFREF
jgi:hypothetical protein